MTPVLKVLMTLSKIPKEDGSRTVGIVKILFIAIIAVVLVLAAPMSLVSGLQGADLDAEVIDPFESFFYARVDELYEEYMDELREVAQERKSEYEKKGLKTITETVDEWVEGYWVQEREEFIAYIPIEINGSKGMMPQKQYRMVDVWVEGYWITGEREKEVQTSLVTIDIQDSDLALILAYFTITGQMVAPEDFDDDAVTEFMEKFLKVHTTTIYLTNAEKEAATGDDRYIEKKITIFNRPLSADAIARYFFKDDETTKEMFLQSVNLYQHFLNKGKKEDG